MHVEYNSFIQRTCQIIYNARYLGTWQYLVDLPFNDLNIAGLWNLYYSLSVGFSENFIQVQYNDIPTKVEDGNFMRQFNDVIIEVPADDLYYLLQTFGNMILSRDKSDWDFIRIVSIRLFEVRLINIIVLKIVELLN